MKKLVFYNTLTRKEDVFKPIGKEVKMYTCGPTVYGYATIGNMRSYVFSDLVRRALMLNGYKVRQVVNVTDVGHLTSDADTGEDKVEKAAALAGKRAGEITRFYFDAFLKDYGKLNILSPWKWTWASKHIKEQIDLIKKLEKKGYTYKTSDGVYFNTKKFKDYGKLGKLNLSGLEAGKRVDIGEKKNKTDFALWKFSSGEKRQQQWNSPWGIGFPGWHIECSAMAMKYLGERLDIHTGGEDHVTVHHTNEIAQSECASGKKFSNYWLHGAFLTFSGAKVSKSTGGLYTVSELEQQGYNALAFRYLCLQTHYRKQLDFSLASLDAAQNAYDKIKRRVIELRKEKHKGRDFSETYLAQFTNAVNDDLNMSKALDVFYQVLGDFDFSPNKKLKLLEKFDQVLGLGVKDMKESRLSIPAQVKALVKSRELARKERKWAEADVLRERIREFGYSIEDSPEGTKISKI